MTKKLFIYGTLKQDGCRASAMEGKFLGYVETLPEHKLIDCGSYPGLIYDKDGGLSIKGELWEVDESLMDHKLDQIEGVPILYKRGQVKIKDCEDEVLTYIYQGKSKNYCGNEWKNK